MSKLNLEVLSEASSFRHRTYFALHEVPLHATFIFSHWICTYAILDFPSPHIFYTCCLCPVFLTKVCCCHIDDILIKTVMFASDCHPTSSLLHHYIFYFLLEDLFVFVHISVWKRWIISKVVELAHRINIWHATNLVCRLSPRHALTNWCYLGAKLPGEACWLRAWRESFIIE